MQSKARGIQSDGAETYVSAVCRADDKQQSTPFHELARRAAGKIPSSLDTRCANHAISHQIFRMDERTFIFGANSSRDAWRFRNQTSGRKGAGTIHPYQYGSVQWKVQGGSPEVVRYDIREVSLPTGFVELINFLNFSRSGWPTALDLFAFYAHLGGLSSAYESCLVCAPGRTLH